MRQTGIIIRILTIVMLTFFIMSCGQEEPADLSFDKKDRTEPVELDVWIMDPGTGKLDILNNMFAKFESENPNITVKLLSVPWIQGHDKINSTILGGNVPDLCEMGTTWNVEFADFGALMDMTDRIEKLPYKDDLHPALLSAGAIDGRYYGMPWYAGCRSMIYRKDWFEEEGVKVPETWEELRAAAVAMTKDLDGDGNIDRYGMAINGRSTHAYMPFIWSNGGRIMKKENGKWYPAISEKPAVEALDFFASLYYKDKISPEGSTIWNEKDSRGSFNTGKTAMIIDGIWAVLELEKNAPELAEKYGITLIPRSDEFTTFLGGSNLTIFEKAKHKEEAWELVQFMCRPDILTEWGKAVGFFPGRMSTYSRPEFTEDPLMNSFSEQIKYGHVYPSTVQWGKIEETKIFVSMMQDIMNKKKTAQEAADEVSEKMRDIFKEAYGDDYYN